jgi:hypothetical protein
MEIKEFIKNYREAFGETVGLPIRDSFDKSNFNIFKEPNDSGEQNLFNF